VLLKLRISINGVIQQPNDTTTPTNGFGIDVDSVIVFSTAPLVTDVFWGNLVANNFPTFDIADNTVDSFTGDNVTTDFTLSKYQQIIKMFWLHWMVLAFSILQMQLQLSI
jgi:hypothetical protein